MPFSSKQRRAAFAELSDRNNGGGGKMFGGMSKSDLETYAHAPMEKGSGKSDGKSDGKTGGKKPPFLFGKGKSKPQSSADQAKALMYGGK